MPYTDNYPCVFISAFVQLVYFRTSEIFSYIDTYHSHFIPEGVAEATQIFLRDAHVISKLLGYEEYFRRDRW
jgi:hypothetical protein